MVNGSENRLYAVTLFPTETCQCPCTTRCYHIIAAMKSIGMSIHDKKKRTINLSRLRKRSNQKGKSLWKMTGESFSGFELRYTT